MPATLTTASVILKEIYEKQMQEQLNNDVVALRRIERSSEGVVSEVGGKYVTFPLHTRRNAGIGARNEMEALPTPGQQGYAAARVGLRYLYGSIRLSGQSLKLANENYQAFASVLDQEVEGLKDDLLKDQNRQIYGDGSGAIATAKTATTSTNTFIAQTSMYAQLGMQIDIIDGTTLSNATPTVKASNRQVTAINNSTATLTFDGATVSTAVGDIVVRTGNVNREWSGFGVAFKDTGTFQNVDPTAEPTWKAVIDSNSGTNRPLSEGLMTLMDDNIRAQGRGSRITAIFSNLGVRRAYAALLQQQRRFTNTTEFTGGFSGLAFTTDRGDIPFVVDVDAPLSKAYFVNEKEITLFREADWSFMDMDGSRWSRVTGYDAYDATMYQYSQIGYHKRNTHGVLADITEG